MTRKRGQSGFTLIELMIVVAIIGILAAVAIPLYKANTIKGRMTEVTNAMHYVAQAVGLYAQDAGAGGAPTWPNCTDLASIQSSLGVALGALRVSAANVDQATGVIEMTLTGIDPIVDGQTLTLIPSPHLDGSIDWNWGGTIAAAYLPKK